MAAAGGVGDALGDGSVLLGVSVEVGDGSVPVDAPLVAPPVLPVPPVLPSADQPIRR